LKGGSQLAIKRALDVLLALLALPAFGAISVLIAPAIWLESGAPVFFRLRVAGRGGKAFDQWKFRTMVQGARQKAHPFETSATDPRITRVGRFLRRWSLDELPQLWNVLRGDMSFVGPRPAFVEVASRYGPRESHRLQMRPGITGLAQIQGRNLLPWSERIALDRDYIDHHSLRLDCKILFRTIPVWFRGTGVYGEDGKVTMHDLA
jgi:lipopolysaccharide/colanic/teichoic acid biosynthesis glycosyltransferase